jgi:FKBP-type peptidyl-prolyl cis-trans isomerase FkpA
MLPTFKLLQLSNMNMIRTAYALIGLLTLCVSCKNSEKETPSGLKFNIVDKGDGVLPKKEEIVVFQFIMKDSKDSVWSSTYERGMPGFLMINDSSEIKNEDGMEQMFRMLSKGDSATVVMPITKLFRDVFKQPLPDQLDSTLSISYLIRIDEIMDKEKFREYQTNLMETKRKSQGKKDEEKITKYLAEKNVNAQRDTSGLHYVIHTKGGKQNPTTESCVVVNYRGSLLEDGREFDANSNLSFPLGGVIEGWRVGIPLLGIGDSATMYIPSSMAYGPQGVPGAIPPDAVLIFDVKLISIGQGYDQATRSCK